MLLKVILVNLEVLGEKKVLKSLYMLNNLCFKDWKYIFYCDLVFISWVLFLCFRLVLKFLCGLGWFWIGDVFFLLILLNIGMCYFIKLDGENVWKV